MRERERESRERETDRQTESERERERGGGGGAKTEKTESKKGHHSIIDSLENISDVSNSPVLYNV